MRSTFRILFYLKKGNPKKNGKFAIMARITVDGKLTQFSTKLEILASEWDVKSGKVKGNSAKSINLNRKLDILKVKASEHYTSLINQLQFATPERIKNLLLGFEEKKKTIISYFDKFNEQYKQKVGTTTTWTTYTKYILTRNRLEEFIETTKGINDLHISELNSILLEDFYLFLRNTHNSGNNNAMKNLQRLRTVINYIKNTGETFIDPYSNFKMKFEKSDRDFLEMEEIEKIYNKKFASDRLDKVRDVFLFCCYTGLAYSDTRDLEKRDLRTGADGNLWIMSERNKSKVDFKVLLLDIPKAILKKYEGKQKDGKLLPVVSNKNMNEYLHEIATICGIDKRITSHVARHTFATLCLTEDMPIESVSKALGHTNIRTTQIYARIIDRKLTKDMNMLASKLNKTLPQP